MKIKLNLDNRGYREKPVEHYGEIRNRLYTPERTAEITPEALAQAIEQGRSFTPAVMENTTKDGWRAQQLFCVDIDNDTADPLLPEEALQICDDYGLHPYFMYHTFSNTAERPRYRMVFVLDRAITGAGMAEDLFKRLPALISQKRPGSADPASGQIDRMFAGGRPGSVFYRSEHITAVADLEKLPPVKVELPPVKEYTPPERIAGGKLEELERRVEEAKTSFDLAGWIASTTGSKLVKHGSRIFFNPCPVCGHNDCFNVSGEKWACMSANHKPLKVGKTPGGTIIELLEQLNGWDYGTARDHFKYELLRLDPEEWKAAWKADKEEQERRQAAQEAAQAQKEKKAKSMQQFLTKIQSAAYKPFETGLPFFDDLLGGGVIPQSLLLVMAAPGAGKTTLCQQIAESMAAHGRKVLYVNLEMAREQMFAKALSARLARRGIEASALQILQGYAWPEELKTEILREAEAYEREIMPALTYYAAAANLDSFLAFLDQTGADAAAAGESAPAVILDYLHLLQRPGSEVTETVKAAVVGLKQYAAKYNTFALGIVATNRTSNKSGVLTMESGRDSSALEYTADVILSLNYYEIDKGEILPSEVEEVSKLQRAPWRRMVLRVLKGRFIQPGRSENLYFVPKQNIFYGENEQEFFPADPNIIPFKATKPKPQKRF